MFAGFAKLKRSERDLSGQTISAKTVKSGLKVVIGKPVC